MFPSPHLHSLICNLDQFSTSKMGITVPESEVTDPNLPSVDFSPPYANGLLTPAPEIQVEDTAKSSGVETENHQASFDAIGTLRRFSKNHELDPNLPIEELDAVDNAVEAAERGNAEEGKEVEREIMEENSPYPEVSHLPQRNPSPELTRIGTSRSSSNRQHLPPRIHNPRLGHRPPTHYARRRNQLSLLAAQSLYRINYLRYPTDRLPPWSRLGSHLPRPCVHRLGCELQPRAWQVQYQGTHYHCCHGECCVCRGRDLCHGFAGQSADLLWTGFWMGIPDLVCGYEPDAWVRVGGDL